jgi:hypothetical protein
MAARRDTAQRGAESLRGDLHVTRVEHDPALEQHCARVDDVGVVGHRPQMVKRLRILRLAVVADADVQGYLRAYRRVRASRVGVCGVQRREPVAELAQLEQRRAFEHSRGERFVSRFGAQVQATHRVQRAVRAVERDVRARAD